MTSEIVEQHIACEVCGSSDAKCVYADGHSYCYSCNTFNGVKKDDEAYTYEYLPWRGVNKNTMEFYGIKTKVASNGSPISLGYPYANEAYKIRRLSEKAFYTAGPIATSGLFGQHKFEAGTHKFVTITEGELDACSLYQVLKSPVVSVQSASSAVRDCTSAHSWLNSFERIYIAFDNDGPGREATARVARMFDFAKVYVVKFNKYKDANDYLVHGEQTELSNIWWNSKKFLPENIVSSFSEFKKILTEEKNVGVPYPFPKLTEMTYGIRRGESVLITAQEGVGKTELMHAIEHQLLKETKDGVGAIFLEEPKQRHLQALAGIGLQRPAHLPDSGCTDDQVYHSLEQVIGVDGRLHLYSHFGSDDPGVFLDTIRFLVVACGCWYVLLDHITMVVSGLAGEDERKALDYLSTRLEMMVKELNFALIMVSHVNDLGQTRGSRYISKVADVRIDAIRDLTSSDPITRNTTFLKVSKNRFSGITGPADILYFDPSTHCYKIASNDNAQPLGSANRRDERISGYDLPKQKTA